MLPVLASVRYSSYFRDVQLVNACISIFHSFDCSGVLMTVSSLFCRFGLRGNMIATATTVGTAMEEEGKELENACSK